MINTDLKVLVSGGAGSGKTTLVNIISKVLSDVGFETVTIDEDHGNERTNEQVKLITNKLISNGALMIETIQRNRSKLRITTTTKMDALRATDEWARQSEKEAIQLARLQMAHGLIK
jgi:ABC-type lipoprotein export system ATPase subunit